MRTDEHIEALQREGDLLGAAIDGGDLTAQVPHCPKWTVADLVRHIGGVHRRVAAIVGDARVEPLIDEAERARLAGPVPADDTALPAWYREGHAHIVETLRAAPADLQCWTLAPSGGAPPRAFWARRQAHETAIHRFDAQEPFGRPDAFPAGFAADGVDELLVGLLDATRGRRGKRRIKADSAVALHVHATDADRHWTVQLGPEGVRASARREPADCSVSGPATVLYPLLWNRLDLDAISVDGDDRVLELWRSAVMF